MPSNHIKIDNSPDPIVQLYTPSGKLTAQGREKLEAEIAGMTQAQIVDRLAKCMETTFTEMKRGHMAEQELSNMKRGKKKY